jgi:homocysteine S-methyltransferase
MSDTWRERLGAGRVLLVDGGIGSELHRRGFALDARAWSAPAALTDFELLRSIHSDYIAAGADVISTNTFAATRFVLEAAGLGQQTAEVVQRSVAAAREARDAIGRDVAIAGSISCLPPSFDPEGYPSAQSESDAYREIAEQLALEGADVIALEMLEDTEHAARACAAVRATGLPIWLGVSCRLNDDGALVAFDFPETPLGRVLDALLPFAPDAVNVMHSPPGAVAPALRAIGARSRTVIGAYPELEGGITGFATERAGATGADSTRAAARSKRPTLSPTELVAFASYWIGAGARIVGGCCGATPSHVRALRAAIDSLEKSGG